VISLGSIGLSSVSSVLCLGAHADDIEIGCGATILKLLSTNPGMTVDWVVLSGQEEREAEARRGAHLFLDRARARNVWVEQFENRFFPCQRREIKDGFDRLGALVGPDLVFTHYGGDRHQDHRLVSELTWNTFRDHLILEYEIPKYDGDLGRPNAFVTLDRATCERKIDLLLDAFPSQREKPWFSAETFWATLRLRGIECRAPHGYAEAFHCRKVVLS
jgi:LmbE family N-acetylglucosaminyl deacetylase